MGMAARVHALLRIAATIAASCMALVLAGCSTPAMKSTPIWDADYPEAHGRPEDRVNVWPLYYRRDPAISVLWPLASFTPDGHAIVPFYEWTAKGRVLRHGTVHQYIPALAWFGAEGGGWRVLIAGGNRKERWWIVPPLVWAGKQGFWTPPLMRVETPHEVARWGILFPLTGLRTGPDGTNAWIFPLAISKRAGEQRDLHLLWPLSQFARRSDGGRVIRVIPLWWRESWPGGLAFASIPWGDIDYGGGKRTRWLLPPAWVSTGSKERGWSSVMLLAHEVRIPGGTGRGVVPLFYSYRDRDGSGHRFYALPLSLFRSSDTDRGWSAYVLGGIGKLWRSTRGGGSWLFPLFVHEEHRDRGASMTLTPLVSRVKSAESTDAWFSPLASFGRWENGRFVNVAAFVFHFFSSDERTEWTLLGPLAHSNRMAGGDGSTWMLAPLVRTWNSGERHGSWFFPFYFHDERPASGRSTTVTPVAVKLRSGDSTDALFTPIASGGNWGGGRFVNILGPVANRFSNAERREWWLLAPLFHFDKCKDDVGESHAFPFFWTSCTGERREFRLLLGLLFSRMKDDRDPEGISQELSGFKRQRNVDLWREGALLWIFGHREKLVATPAAPKVAGPVGEAHTPSTTEENAIVRRERSWWVFPLLHGSRDDAGGRTLNVLWRLWDEDRHLASGGEEYVRQRLLWRIYHRERLGTQTSTDVFPFLAFDKSDEGASWSFAGGLAGHRRDLSGRSWRFLWIPFGTRATDEAP